MISKKLLILSTLFIAAAGCSSGKKSKRGFRLPDGDIAAGRTAFLDLKCNVCHAVTEEEDFPPPTAKPPVPVRLGGHVPTPRTDGELLTSIVNPSHSILFKNMSNNVAHGDESRMGDYADAMTVRQLLDLVAFLHSKYRTPTPMPGN